MLDALRPPGGERPTIAIVGLNDATEIADYVYPAGVLRRANVADVVMLATSPGPVQLYPALTVQPDETTTQFDARLPEGADYVIVPAMSPDDDPAVMSWLRQQSDKGAIIIGVCAGAKVVAAAGLLDGKQATTHWYYLRDLLKLQPNIHYVPDRRMVMDANVVTTTGISASMPMMLTLIEAIGGRDRAEAVARELGIEQWDARHASGAFKFTREFATHVLGNTLAFWNRDELGIALEPGIDELSLALVADAWSRTYRSRTVTFAETDEVVSLGGIRILPDRKASEWPEEDVVPLFPAQPVADVMDLTLAGIGARYGEGTTDIVAMQLEYLSPTTGP
jgi:putative intracellular protease/amidase